MPTNERSVVTWLTMAAAITAGMGGLLEGFDAGVISGALLFLTKYFHLTVVMKEYAATSILVGGTLGAFLAAPLSNRWGRRNVMLITAAVFAIFTFGITISQSFILLIINRTLVGVGIGLTSVVGSMYVSEMSPAQKRGALIATYQIAISFGMGASFWTDFLFARYGHGNIWRDMFVVGTIPAVIMFVILCFLPDTPRWYVLKGSIEKAQKVMKKIVLDDSVARRDVEAMQNELIQEKGKLREFFLPGLRTALIFGVGLGLILQISGIGAINFYTPTLLQMAGLRSPSVAILITALIAIVTLVATISVIFFVDRTGRRPSLLVSLTGIMLSLLGLSVLFYYKSLISTHTLGMIAFVLIMIYKISFAIGLGPIFWVYVSEIYPLRLRAAGASATHVAQWAANVFVTLTFLSFVAVLGASGTFLLYTFISLMSLLFVWKLAPETKGQRLEDMYLHWTKKGDVPQ